MRIKLYTPHDPQHWNKIYRNPVPILTSVVEAFHVEAASVQALSGQDAGNSSGSKQVFYNLFNQIFLNI